MVECSDIRVLNYDSSVPSMSSLKVGFVPITPIVLWSLLGHATHRTLSRMIDISKQQQLVFLVMLRYYAHLHWSILILDHVSNSAMALYLSTFIHFGLCLYYPFCIGIMLSILIQIDCSQFQLCFGLILICFDPYDHWLRFSLIYSFILHKYDVSSERFRLAGGHR